MGEIIAIIATMAYALGGVFARRESISSSSPTTSAFSGVLISMFMTLIISGGIWIAKLLYQNEFQMNTIGLLYFIAAGLLTVFFGRSFLYVAIRYLGALRIAALKNLIPLLTLILAIFLLGDSFTLSLAIGGTFIFLGLALMVYQNMTILSKTIDVDRNHPKETKSTLARSSVGLGYLYGVLAMVAYAFGTMFRKLGVVFLPDPYFGAFVGAITGLVFFYISAAFSQNYWIAVKNLFKTWRPNLWISGISLSVGQLLLYVALSFIELSRVSLIIATESIVTIIILRILKMREKVTMITIVASLIVITGAFYILLF